MTGRKAVRSEETRRAILQAAGDLFRVRGYDAVTMREIAKVADCSHTAIYIYFQDKEALLHQLALAPLQALEAELRAVLQGGELTAGERVWRMCRTFISFGLEHRNMYTVLFMVRAGRVDVAEPELELNQMRNRLFGLLRQAVAQLLPPGRSDKELWAYARTLFFTLHGIVMLYAGSEEPLESVMERLGATFDLAVDVALAGITQVGGK